MLMPSFLPLIFIGIRQSLRTRQRKWLFLIISLLAFALLFSLPVFTVPGNSFAFQLTITRWIDVSMLTLLSLLLGLVIILQLENRKCGKTCKASVASAVGKSGAATFGVAGAALLGTAACSSCIAGILALFGIGATVSFVLLDYRWYLIGGILLLTLIFVLLTARKIGNGACSVPPSTPNDHS